MKISESQITEIQIIPIKPKDGLVAFASCVYNSVCLQSIAIYTRADGSGYRLVYPTKILPINGKQINLFYPINKETGDKIEKAIIVAFENLMKKGGKENGGKQIMDIDGSKAGSNK